MQPAICRRHSIDRNLNETADVDAARACRISLEIHAAKSKTLSSVSDDLPGKSNWVEVAGTSIEILKREESTAYSAWQRTLGDKV